MLRQYKGWIKEFLANAGVLIFFALLFLIPYNSTKYEGTIIKIRNDDILWFMPEGGYVKTPATIVSLAEFPGKEFSIKNAQFKEAGVGIYDRVKIAMPRLTYSGMCDLKRL